MATKIIFILVLVVNAHIIKFNFIESDWLYLNLASDVF